MTPSKIPLCVHCDLRPAFNATMHHCWDCWADAETVSNLEHDLASTSAIRTPYICGYCSKQNDDIFPESCSLTGDILSVQMATIVQFQSQYSGDGFIFCDVECFGAWLEPRVHRLFEDDAEEEPNRAREVAIGAALPANWSVR